MKVSLFLFFLCQATAAKSLEAHVHGALCLDIATEKNDLLIMVKSSAESLLEFEHKAKSKEELETLGKVKDLWGEKITELFGAKTLEDCKITKSDWQQKFSGKPHSTIFIEAYLSCKTPLQKRELEISIIENFRRVKNISLQLMREDGTVYKETHSDKRFKLRL